MVDLLALVDDYEVFFETLEELGRRQAVEVAHHAVVVDNLEVRGRECHGEEVVVFLVATVVGVLFCLLVAYERGGGTAVMAVGYVEVWYFVEGGCDAVVEGFVDYPEGVAEAVVGYKVVFGLIGCDGADYLFEVGIVGEGEEHRLDVGVVDAHVFHAVFLFVAPGQLVLLYAAFHIVGHVGCHYYAILGAAVHGLGIDIVVFLGVLYEPAVFAELGKVADGAVVDLGGVFVGAGGKVDFGFDDVVERFGIALGFGTCLVAVEYVVGARGDFGHELAGRTDAAKGFNFGHDIDLGGIRCEK